jgi:hypothetical protein
MKKSLRQPKRHWGPFAHAYHGLAHAYVLIYHNIRNFYHVIIVQVVKEQIQIEITKETTREKARATTYFTSNN